MSGGVACHCEERKKPVRERNWEVITYKCNHSAFNGYHRTSSDYSLVTCHSCGGYWRTKAAFVDLLYGVQEARREDEGGEE